MSYHPRNHHTSWVRRDQAILAGDADKAAARIGFRVSGWGSWTLTFGLGPPVPSRPFQPVPTSTNQYQKVHLTWAFAASARPYLWITITDRPLEHSLEDLPVEKRRRLGDGPYVEGALATRPFV